MFDMSLIWNQESLFDEKGNLREKDFHDNGDEEIISNLALRSDYTDDFDWLRMYSHILYFNYIPKFRASNHEMCKYLEADRSAYLGKAHTVTDHFVVRETFNNQSTIAFRSEKQGMNSVKYQAHVRGDLYALTPEAFLNMDRLVGNTFRYDRQQTFVYPKDQISPFREGLKSSVKAMIYLGIEEFWENFNLRTVPQSKDVESQKWIWS